MYPSVEARWFLRGEVPPAVLKWFKNKDTSDSGLRVDHYLRLPGMVSIGVKLREGNYETKPRQGELGQEQFAADVAGRVAFWRKWSFKLAKPAGDQPPDSHWVTVEKRRYLRKYKIANGQATPFDPLDFIATDTLGCNVELTKLDVAGDPWWTVGFEAFGADDPDKLRDVLRLTAAECFSGAGRPALRVEDSYDYPEWLDRFF